MGNLLFIDSDDIITLSDALRAALERRGVIFNGGGTYGHPTTDDEEPDIDPYLGVMPNRRHQTPSQYGGCGGWADEANYGGCGGSGNRCASCGTTSHYGHCGGGC